MKNTYIHNWFQDFWGIFTYELKTVFTDGGFLIIYLAACFGYPILYNIIYKNGILEETPVAIVDNADCRSSRDYIRAVDATRELKVAFKCTDMEQAKQLMAQRKVNGILFFPNDFGYMVDSGQTAKLSIYADMSSFLYYKNLLMGTEFVMLSKIQAANVSAIAYDENIPYNRTFSYSIFLISAILLLIIQQVMFYGMSLLNGTAREEHNSFATLPMHLHGHGAFRVVFARGAVYFLIFMAAGLYIATVVPGMFNFPQRGSFWDVVILLLFFVTDCIFFCFTWSSFITRRESVFVLLLFMSPILVFLTGFSWPDCAFPSFWKAFSYLFPSTFGCKAFINLNTAGGSLETIRPQMIAMVIQSICYYFLAAVLFYTERKIKFVR